MMRGKAENKKPVYIEVAEELCSVVARLIAHRRQSVYQSCMNGYLAMLSARVDNHHVLVLISLEGTRQ